MSQQLALAFKTRPDASLENFFPAHNQQALAAVQALLAEPGFAQLYLSGPAGCGKSHLLMAAASRATDLHIPCAYLPLGECVQSPPGMLEGLAHYGLLALDDVDAIAGNSEWEHALFVLYNQARDLGCRLLIAGNAGPAALSIKMPDLKSRLCWGLSWQLKPLVDEDKVELLRQNAASRGLSLPVEVATWLIQHHSRDLPSLIASLDRLDRASLAEQRRLTLPFVKACLNRQ